MIASLLSSYSAPLILDGVAGWMLGVVRHVPGEIGMLADHAGRAAERWGVPVPDTPGLWSSVPVAVLTAAAGFLALGALSGTVALVHGVRERRRAQPRR